ncbi:MAG: hypothetical protein R2706_10005 [Acidimicrobiales bacterium]
MGPRHRRWCEALSAERAGHDADFRARRPLIFAPVRVTGRNGITLEQAWAGGAVSHLGLAVPGFPNFFLLAGPNTRLAHNPMKLLVDAQIGAIVSLLHTLDARQADEVEVSRGGLGIVCRGSEAVQRWTKRLCVAGLNLVVPLALQAAIAKTVLFRAAPAHIGPTN